MMASQTGAFDNLMVAFAALLVAYMLYEGFRKYWPKETPYD